MSLAQGNPAAPFNGIPPIIIVSFLRRAVTPLGNPVAEKPVAPVTRMRTLSIKLPAHRVWLVVELEETKAKVLKGLTTKKPLAAAVAPPVQPIRSI